METIPATEMVLFAAVVREGSFTRAALALGVTTQTVSERIAKLEARLSVRLLERTTRRVRVTDAGAAYYERCAMIAALIDEANNEVLSRRAEPMGLLRVSAPTLYGRRFLSPVIADVLARYPKLHLHVVLANRRVSLIEEGFDIAIRVGALDDSSFAARKLGDGFLYVVARPGLVAKSQARTATEQSLATLPTVGLRPVEVWSVRGVPIKVEPKLVVNDLEMACDAAIAGVGIALLPSIVCKQALLDRRLEVLFGAEPVTSQPVYAMFPSRRYIPPKVRVFLEALERMTEPMAPIVFEKRTRARR